MVLLRRLRRHESSLESRVKSASLARVQQQRSPFAQRYVLFMSLVVCLSTNLARPHAGTTSTFLALANASGRLVIEKYESCMGRGWRNVSV